MTGIKICSLGAVIAASDTINPILGLPYEQVGGMAIAAVCVWRMWQLIERQGKTLERLVNAMEQKPCLHGQLPTEKPPEDKTK